ncbi:hypothetical protein [Plebeiibacterium marinum]|uniref:Transglutaminase-like domain-containing protein n=1 Tax=Plebeiibacterium marinum TaxID=2992111 RepID=A0AAE3MAQ1_9BACT|nr:hypothetical protein [Plebeiobacterium marinum]MCW3804253.1 hypothetical protein [Plebeiobacterium marinum]
MKTKQFLLVLTTLFITFCNVLAQIDEKDPFEEMNRRYEAKMDKMHQDYENKMKQMEAEYAAHIKEMNEAFEKYLGQNFTEVEQKKEVEKPKEAPKPIDQPVYKPIKISDPKKDLAPIPAPITPKIALSEAPAYSIAPIVQQPEESDNFKQNISVDFFETEVSLNIDSRMKSLSLASVSPDNFANYWKEFTKTYYQVYIESMMDFAAQANLNDWGIYQLINKTSKTLYTSSNNQELWKWAMLNQAGYQAKIGYNGNTVCLMLPFIQEVYEKPYYYINGYNYYLIDNKLGKKNLYTYEENFGGATKAIDLHLPYALNLSNSKTIVKKTTLPNESSPLELHMNKSNMLFLASFPQTNNKVYLEAAMSGTVKDELYDYIRPRIKDMSETEAVSYLLKYLHNSFQYKTDRDQFGKEKMFFPDEIFYYPYSDCEDRTVLFTRLVGDLIGLDAVALTYFSHMAAAVSFSQPVEGYNFVVGDKNYTICDPTYINAPIGSVMPEYKDYTPIAIKINNNSQMNNIWQMIAQSIEANNKGNIFINNRTIAENGKYIVSGWYDSDIQIGDKNFSSHNGTRDLWFATFDNKGDMEWFLPVNCSNFGFTQAFNVGKKGNVYALINYAGAISISNRRICQSEQSAHLILGISNRAQTILHENIDFEAPEGKKLAFYGKFRPDGTKVDLVSFPTDKVRFDSKITVDSQNDIVVRGIVGEIEGLTKDVPITLTTSTYSTEDQLESFIDDYKTQSFNKHMVPLFAALKILSQNGGSFSGINVRNLINKNNPSFPKNNPGIYESLLRMQFVVNKGGVVKIETYKGKKISLDAMNIENNANMQIVNTSATSYKLNFLNGVQVGKAFIWFDLNSISLDKTGDMVFDYDDDHTKKNFKIEDILD